MNFIELSRKVDRVLVRNYGIFFLALASCTGILVFILISGDRTIAKIDSQVDHTYKVINSAQALSATVEGVVAAQRGYIITGEDKFLEKYHSRRDRVSELIAGLSELTNDNPSQVSRLDELRHHFNDLSVKLEQRAQTITLTAKSKIILDDIEEADGLKDNILRINSSILREEYDLLNDRIRAIEIQKSRYFTTLLIGIVATAALLLLFNGFLLNAQRKRNHMEASLRETEERFALAIEGTRDGIFDWDIPAGKIFYSSQFFGMLGYERSAFLGTEEEFREHIHPEDVERAWEYISHYTEGKLSEYSQEFRMKSSTGRWIWVQSRAKAIFNTAGKAVRLVGAHTDISYLKEHQARLEMEKKTAEEANQAKSDFLAHMSHEIRTPLTAISGIAEIFEKKQENLDDKQKRLVRTLHSSTGILKDIINDILDFSKIESGDLQLEDTHFRLGALFEEVTAMMALRANEKGISFVFDYSDVRDVEFRGDKIRLRQILVNLVGNGIKFTKDGGVFVKAYKQDREDRQVLQIDVTDTGIGISVENFDLIFERFKQADASVSRKYGGTGLGLPISRNLATLMGGNIILSSEIGKGSTFSVYLPLRTADHVSVDANVTSLRPEKSDKKDMNPVQGQNRILMVEDYEGNIVVIGHILEELAYPYDIARTGVEALTLWEKNSYSLVLMDIQMPEMDGFAATQAIRSHEMANSSPRTPIIGMTAHALVGDKDKCIAAGMDAYLPKPIVEADLRHTILKYIQSKTKAA